MNIREWFIVMALRDMTQRLGDELELNECLSKSGEYCAEDEWCREHAEELTDDPEYVCPYCSGLDALDGVGKLLAALEAS